MRRRLPAAVLATASSAALAWNSDGAANPTNALAHHDHVLHGLGRRRSIGFQRGTIGRRAQDPDRRAFRAARCRTESDACPVTRSRRFGSGSGRAHHLPLATGVTAMSDSTGLRERLRDVFRLRPDRRRSSLRCSPRGRSCHRAPPARRVHLPSLAARPRSSSRAVAAAWRIGGNVLRRGPAAGRDAVVGDQVGVGHDQVNPARAATRSSSAAACESWARAPWPSSTLPRHHGNRAVLIQDGFSRPRASARIVRSPVARASCP